MFLDITPNGSLRRRRSRVLSEEDEGNLMDFLRASGHDSSRERKSWGSLGRLCSRRLFFSRVLYFFKLFQIDRGQDELEVVREKGLPYLVPIFQRNEKDPLHHHR